MADFAEAHSKLLLAEMIQIKYAYAEQMIVQGNYDSGPPAENELPDSTFLSLRTGDEIASFEFDREHHPAVVAARDRYLESRAEAANVEATDFNSKPHSERAKIILEHEEAFEECQEYLKSIKPWVAEHRRLPNDYVERMAAFRERMLPGHLRVADDFTVRGLDYRLK